MAEEELDERVAVPARGAVIEAPGQGGPVAVAGLSGLPGEKGQELEVPVSLGDALRVLPVAHVVQACAVRGDLVQEGADDVAPEGPQRGLLDVQVVVAGGPERGPPGTEAGGVGVHEVRQTGVVGAAGGVPDPAPDGGRPHGLVEGVGLAVAARPGPPGPVEQVHGAGRVAVDGAAHEQMIGAALADAIRVDGRVGRPGAAVMGHVPEIVVVGQDDGPVFGALGVAQGVVGPVVAQGQVAVVSDPVALLVVRIGLLRVPGQIQGAGDVGRVAGQAVHEGRVRDGLRIAHPLGPGFVPRIHVGVHRGLEALPFGRVALPCRLQCVEPFLGQPEARMRSGGVEGRGKGVVLRQGGQGGQKQQKQQEQFRHGAARRCGGLDGAPAGCGFRRRLPDAMPRRQGASRSRSRAAPTGGKSTRGATARSTARSKAEASMPEAA